MCRFQRIREQTIVIEKHAPKVIQFEWDHKLLTTKDLY